jgi:hypothetical protein
LRQDALETSTENVQCLEAKASQAVDSAEQSNAADEVDSVEANKPFDVPDDSNEDTTAHDGRLEDTSAALYVFKVVVGGADLSKSCSETQDIGASTPAIPIGMRWHRLWTNKTTRMKTQLLETTVLIE